ncbi:hypothetical protein GmHk_10G027451 [Glycine max]|nr:hypothetical protein GmHk_10G027451 [Glycine max]
MSSTTVVGSISTTAALTPLLPSSRTSRSTFGANSTSTSFPATPLSSNLLFFKLNHTSSSSSKRTSTFHGFKRFSPVMEWQDCTVKMEIDVPISVAYTCYSDREAIPNWMPFISSVKILPDKPDLSRWSLKYKAFGRDIEFSWLARNMQEKIPNLILYLFFSINSLYLQLLFVIHVISPSCSPFQIRKFTGDLWKVFQTVQHRVKIFEMYDSKEKFRYHILEPDLKLVGIYLTVSYEVPQLLAPVASALQPFLEGLLQRGLERFATFAKSYT